MVRWHAFGQQHVDVVRTPRVQLAIPPRYRGPGREACTGTTYEADESPNDYLGDDSS